VRAAQKDWNGAAGNYQAAVQLQPRYTPAMVAFARALQQQGKLEQAAQELEKGGDDPAILAALGSAYRRAGHYQKAIDTHSKLNKKDPQTAMLLGADHFAIGQFDQAINDYSGVLETDRDNARARHDLVLALTRRAQMHAQNEGALFDLRRAYDLEPSESLAQSLAAVELAQQKWAEAENTLSARVLEKKAQPRTQLLYGYALLGQKKASDALAAFQQLGEMPEARLGWALSKVELGEYDAAAKELQSMKTAPAAVKANLPMVLIRLGYKRLEEGDVAGATRELQAAGSLDKMSAATGPSELLRALIAVEQKQYPGALAGIRSALSDKQPWFEPAARPLLEAYVDYRMGKLAEARKLLAAAQKQGKLPFVPKLAHAVDEREAAELYAQNAAGSQPKIEKLLKTSDEDPRALHNLACARYRHGGQAQALATWRSLSSKVPEAELNLGLHALQVEHDAKSALGHFRRYAGVAGARAGQAREWVERLQQLYEEESK
jgi:Flp pilus assembly protein TadD